MRSCGLATVSSILSATLLLCATALGQSTRNNNETSNSSRNPRGSGKHELPARPLNNNSASQAGAMMQRTNGSLLKATLAAPADPNQAKLGQVSYFAVPEPEPRTMKKHDLVTIIVREESEIVSKGTKDFKKQAELDAKLDQFVKLSVKGPSLYGLPTPANPPEVHATGLRNFTGEGNLDRTDSLTARITAEVLDVKPNGTLVLQARKRIKTDEEEQQFILTGICRVEDVTADNTLLSTQIYDLELQKNHKGDVRNATKRGLLPKLLDLVNPF